MEASMVSKKRKTWVILVPAIAILVLAGGVVAGFTLLGNNAGDKVLTQTLSEALGNANAARFDINTGTGNLTIDRLSSGEDLLASGTLEYLESQGRPMGTVDMNGDLYTFTLKASSSRKAGFQLPWMACNGETNWLIYLNPKVPSEIMAHSGGGNVKINLAGMILTQLVADTGGGNVEVTLPEKAAGLNVTAKTGGGDVSVAVGSGTNGSNSVSAISGAGNVTVQVPGSLAARIHADSGAGKVVVDPRFSQVDKNTFQSPGYDTASDKIEIILQSGAGNVTVNTK